MSLLFINTGGTFNKRYNPISGTLEVPKDDLALQKLLESVGDNIDYRVLGAVYKDSLEMNQSDRDEIFQIVKSSEERYIIIIHGTDTMDLTAQFLSENVPDKVVILTGAMVPISIGGSDGAINLGVSIGFLSQNPDNGIYISMSGIVSESIKIEKVREEGIFKRK
jgi:L-asparaginase